MRNANFVAWLIGKSLGVGKKVAAGQGGGKKESCWGRKVESKSARNLDNPAPYPALCQVPSFWVPGDEPNDQNYTPRTFQPHPVLQMRSVSQDANIRQRHNTDGLQGVCFMSLRRYTICISHVHVSLCHSSNQ